MNWLFQNVKHMGNVCISNDIILFVFVWCLCSEIALKKNPPFKIPVTEISPADLFIVCRNIIGICVIINAGPYLLIYSCWTTSTTIFAQNIDPIKFHLHAKEHRN